MRTAQESARVQLTAANAAGIHSAPQADRTDRNTSQLDKLAEPISTELEENKHRTATSRKALTSNEFYLGIAGRGRISKGQELIPQLTGQGETRATYCHELPRAHRC